MVLFVLFNEFGMSKSQWKQHPMDNKKCNFIAKLQKIGNVYMYTPKFYNYNKLNNKLIKQKFDNDFEFTLNELDISYHCKELYNNIKHMNDNFILISHSSGYLIAHKFAILYSDKVDYIIDINGGSTNSWYKSLMKEEKIKYIKKIKDKQLKLLFENLKNNIDVEISLKIIDNVVKYNLYKQYLTINSENVKCNILVFNNINDNKIETIDKFNYNNNLCIATNMMPFYFFNKDHFLYFDISKDILGVLVYLL